MNRKYFPVFITVFNLLLPVSLGAYDFGLILNQYAGIGNHPAFEYQADILPRFSFLAGDSGDVFLSAGITLGISDEFYYVPELLRSDFFWRSGNLGFRAGRMQYADPSGLVASGLFDGIRLTHNSKEGSVGLGAWYTGFLYKKNANITMNALDRSSYDAPLNYNDFSKTYFAPRRLLAALDWEHPSVAERLHLSIALAAQIDLSGEDERYHSQYLVLKAVLPSTLPVMNLTFEFSGSLEVAEKQNSGEDEFKIAFAADLGAFWMLPTSFNSRLALTGRYASGETKGAIGAYIPLTNKFYGSIIKAKLPGITVLNLDYTARLAQPYAANLNISYFVRNDLGTYTSYPVNTQDNSGHFLGTEFFALFIWSLFSDIQINLGAGAFLPSLGNANPKGDLQWRAELSAIFALY